MTKVKEQKREMEAMTVDIKTARETGGDGFLTG
jgi:hypothetical protein